VDILGVLAGGGLSVAALAASNWGAHDKPRSGTLA
jgi:hypothetical protein